MKKLITLILVCILVCGTFVPVSAYTYNELVIADNLPIVYNFLGSFAVTATRNDSTMSNKYGLVDAKGNVIVEPYYDYMGLPSEGIMIVGLNVDGDRDTGRTLFGIDKYGAINTNGDVVIPLEYEQLGDFSEGLAATFEEYRYTSYVEYLGEVPSIGHKVGFIDKTGKTVIPSIYEGLVSPFSDGLAIVKKEVDGKCGAIDKNGQVVIPFGKYDYIGPFHNGIAAAAITPSDNVFWFGYIDKTGKVVIPFKFNYTEEFDENGLAKFGDANGGGLLYGLINTKGEIVAPAVYNSIDPFSDGLALVTQYDSNEDLKFGFINTNGELVVPMIYDVAASFSEGLACVGVRNKQFSEYYACFYGFIDTKGNVIVEPNKYDHAASFSEGVAVVGKNAFYKSPYPPEYTLIDTSGKELLTLPIGSDISSTYDGDSILPDFYFRDSSESIGGVIPITKGSTGVLLRNPLYRETANALPTTSKVLVNGAEVSFDAYNINGNNYFKLRDLAYVLNGTQKQFEVTWDGKANAIGLIPGKAYTAVGAELAAGDGVSKTALACNSAIYINGKPVTLTAYNINGNNYFKLRDIGTTFNFDVSWDGINKIISIDTSKGYSAN